MSINNSQFKQYIIIGMLTAIYLCMATQFETETCSRCHGSGNYSYCQDYGDRCFKCHGNKIVLTKRGLAARAYLDKLCTIDAGTVKIGDKIAANGMTHGGKLYNYIGMVTAIKSRQCTRTWVRTMRADGKTLDVTHKTEYEVVEGFGVLASSGATVEFPGCQGYTGIAGIIVEKFSEYIFTLTSKYGESNQTVTGNVRTYPSNSAELVAKALEYQNTLTKTGKVRKAKQYASL